MVNARTPSGHSRIVKRIGAPAALAFVLAGMLRGLRARVREVRRSAGYSVMNLPAADVLTVSPEGTINFPMAGPLAE